MSVDYRVGKMYDEVISRIGSENEWREVCRLTGRIYRYEFDNVLMVYAQKPYASLVADYDTWHKVGRYVKKGSKGIAIFPSRALRPYMRHVFDISDTGGKRQELTWILEGEFISLLIENRHKIRWEDIVTGTVIVQAILLLVIRGQKG